MGLAKLHLAHAAFAGPSTVSDGVGLVPDTLLDPTFYLFPLGPVLAFNELSDFTEFYERFTGSNMDPYFIGRLLSQINREHVTFELSTEAEDTAAVQTLESVFLSPRDPDFPSRMHTAAVPVAATGQDLPYGFRMQEQPAPLVFILPGLGAHRNSNGALALAELAWDQGYSVAVISNAMNFEFIENASTAEVPGFAPTDARDVHEALHQIHLAIEATCHDSVTGGRPHGHMAADVGCTTCHEPHNRHSHDDMLWVSNEGSNLCLTCHLK